MPNFANDIAELFEDHEKFVKSKLAEVPIFIELVNSISSCLEIARAIKIKDHVRSDGFQGIDANAYDKGFGDCISALKNLTRKED